ncbi:GNAT family N-acetyltransferase [Erwinia sp. P6884]|uniref:GNAT family N-acetyltransferase n=1 Tax=Erwinia sp. P6884 TaxID=3141450 RepID=UPI00318F34BF
MIGDINIQITRSPSDSATELIIDNLWKHNEQYAPVHIAPFLLSAVCQGETVAGLVARMWWGVLDIQYLWVAEPFRGKGTGKKLMLMAELEALKHECHLATVDTFSCQAPLFYKKLGYEEYGALSGYAGRYTRHYMSKNLCLPETRGALQP